VPDPAPAKLSVAGPTVAAAFAAHDQLVAGALRAEGHAAVGHYRRRATLPYHVAAQVPGLLTALGRDDVVAWRGGRNPVPARFGVDEDRAWLLGLYVAEGYRRAQQVVVSNTDQSILDRAAATLDGLGLTYHRGPEALSIGSSVLSALLDWMGTGGKASAKRVPPAVFGWSRPLVEAFLAGVVDGDGSVDGGRTSVWTTSAGLVGDLLLLFTRLGRRAGSCRRPARANAVPCWQVYAPDNEHKLLTSVPLPDELLVALRGAAGLTQAAAAQLAGYTHPTDLNNIERRCGRDAVRRSTLGRLRDAYVEAGAGSDDLATLDRLVDGDLLWDEVVAVHDTGVTETIFDLEVRPSGRKIENFLAGSGGVFVSNTAGFIDAGFSGHITLELSNVANLPITLYPGMKIGQVSFLQMTTPADVPYGSSKVGSKYQGQRGPTPSRYWENFEGTAADGA
ncbi:MAG TPA: LAGLIDADG family homing endonuclease, partial [Acidimicrobiales bacterium]|nr:LAGLIDADG family homing endonuclease [Acidimicrobiales bacterium]